MISGYTGQLNPDTGNPEILRDGKVIAVGTYEGFAFHKNNKEQACIVLGAYWEGEVPHEWIGVALEVLLPEAKK